MILRMLNDRIHQHSCHIHCVFNVCTSQYTGNHCSYMRAFNFSSLYVTVYAEIFARRKFSPISPSALIGEIFITRFFCPVLMIT